MDVLSLIHQTNNNMTKQAYSELAATFNKNLSAIRIQMNSKQVADLKAQYNVESGRMGDSHLAKILTLRGIAL